MHDFSLFLLKNWLPVGLAAIVFFSIGLLLAKFIWGRYNQRLSFAVEENLNLASQWSALGASQRDLFKKLRSRWQADRDAWETRIAETETELAAREARVEQLAGQLKGDGKDLPAPVVLDRSNEKRIEVLEARLKDKEQEVELLKEETEQATTPGEFFTQAQTTEDTASETPVTATLSNEQSEEVARRIKELEQDLIDTHDELHAVRSDYEKQSQLVESLESQLIDSADKVEGEISGFRDESDVANAARIGAQDVGRQLGTLLDWKNQESIRLKEEASDIRVENQGIRNQFEALLAWKNKETVRLKAESSALRVVAQEAEILRESLVDTTEALETREKELGEIQSQVAKLEELEISSLAKDEEITDLSERLESTQKSLQKNESSLEEKSLLVSDKEGEIELLTATLKATEAETISQTATIESLEQDVERLTVEVAALEPLERRKELLQAELNDACHEMYDVRNALNERMDEIELLEARLDELDEAEDERSRLDTQLTEARRDFTSLRSRFDEAEGELKDSAGQMEELEAIIEDRSAEVDDLSTEVRQQRDQIRKLKNELAENEGELEAATGQVTSLSAQTSTQEESLTARERRIEDLEEALTERYEEMNSVRMGYDEELKSARYHAARADQLEAELDRRAAVFDETNVRAVTSEEGLERANNLIQELTAKLTDSDQSIDSLKGEMADLSREKEERIRDIEEAGLRIEKLEIAAKNREEEIESIASELKQNRKDAEKSAVAYTATISSLETKNAETLSTLKAESEETISALQQKTEEEISALKAENEETLSALQHKTDDEISTLKAESEETLSALRLKTEEETKTLNRRIERLNTELEETKKAQETSKIAMADLEEALKSSDDKTLKLSGKLDKKEKELIALNEELVALREKLESREAEVVEASNQAEALRAELEAKLEAAVKDSATLIAAKEGTLSELNTEVESLRDQIAEQETALSQYEEQRKQGVEEVEKLRNKVADRGEAIRELQGEISNIMLQRSSRDDEVAHLKEKLRAVEGELREASEASDLQSFVNAEDANISGIEDAIHASLSNESVEEDGGISLDEIEAPAQAESHHEAPIAEPKEPVADAEASDDETVEDENTIFFDEASADLTDTGLNTIDQFARSVRRADRKVKVAVIGFAGAEGTADYTESLSARRADAVRERLLERGVPQSMIAVENSGQDRRFTNWRARRVELVQMAQPVAETVN